MLIAGNWKMFKTAVGDGGFLRRVRARRRGVDVVVCPPYTSLARWPSQSGITRLRPERPLGGRRRLHGRGLGADARSSSASTGSIVGHSERRQHLRRDGRDRRRRAEHALGAGLGMIACVGESEEEREAGQTEEVLRRQVSRARAADEAARRSPTSPSGRSAPAAPRRPEQAQEAHAFIKSLRRRCRSSTAARSSRRTPRSFSPSRTSTARSSAAPRSRSSPSQAICEAAARIRS